MLHMYGYKGCNPQSFNLQAAISIKISEIFQTFMEELCTEEIHLA